MTGDFEGPVKALMTVLVCVGIIVGAGIAAIGVFVGSLW